MSKKGMSTFSKVGHPDWGTGQLIYTNKNRLVNSEYNNRYKLVTDLTYTGCLHFRTL